MRLRRPCEHDRYEEHSTYLETVGAALSHYHNCPGGEFLPEDALVIEKVEGAWPDWTEPASLYIVQILDRLAADQVGEPG